MKNCAVEYKNVGDGWIWTVEIDGTPVLRSIRVHMELEDAQAAAQFWLGKLGLGTKPVKS